MTIAVCWKCGEMKWGAFNPCPKCKAIPSTEDDLVMSLAMSDHYFDQPTMERMGADISAGTPVYLDEATRTSLVNTLRESSLLPVLMAARAKGIEHQPLADPKPWWRRWV